VVANWSFILCHSHPLTTESSLIQSLALSLNFSLIQSLALSLNFSSAYQTQISQTTTTQFNQPTANQPDLIQLEPRKKTPQTNQKPTKESNLHQNFNKTAPVQTLIFYLFYFIFKKANKSTNQPSYTI
jgi:hypothetical protein